MADDYIYRNGVVLASDTPAGARHYHLDTPRLITNALGREGRLPHLPAARRGGHRHQPGCGEASLQATRGTSEVRRE